MTDPRAQNLRLLPGRYAIEHFGRDEESPVVTEWLSMTRAPDGLTIIRRDDAAADGWAAVWSGDTEHAPDATGMLSALIEPLAAAALPVIVSSTYHADLVLVPQDRRDEAVAVLRNAGHSVAR